MANDPPSDSSPFPAPDDIAKVSLPVRTIPADTPLFRIHRTTYSPFYFPTTATNPQHTPTYRFDDPQGLFGVMYTSLQTVGAFAETITRGFFQIPLGHARILSWSEYSDRSVSTIVPQRELRVVDLVNNAGVARLGFDTSLMSCQQYAVPQQWSRLFHDHPDSVDGILYIARHAPACLSLAIFDRMGPDEFTRTVSLPLTPKTTPTEILSYLIEAGFALVP